MTSDSGKVLAGVAVIATMAPDRTFQRTESDSTGRYELHFDAGTGDYLVYAALPGYRAFRRRVTLREPVLALDIRLSSETNQLSAVRVTAQRPRPIPDGGQLRDPTAGDFYAQTLVGGVPPELAGDLNALASTLPGITTTPDGRLTVLGTVGQVEYSFNGVGMSSAEIPRDARVTVRVMESAFDPSIGGFGGALINVGMAQGGRITEEFGRVTLDAPALQRPIGSGLHTGQEFSARALNANADGPIPSHDAWYNTGISVRRTTSPLVSLLNAPPTELAQLGVSPDSVARLRSVASALGLPLTAAGIPDGRYIDHGSFIARLDRYRDPGKYGVLWTNAFSLTALGSFDRAGGFGSSAFTSPSLERHNQSANGQLIAQWLHMTPDYSTELTSSFTAARARTEPALTVPTAAIRLASDFGDESPVITSVTAGGSGLSASSTSSARWETFGQATRYAGSAHKLKLSGRMRLSSAAIDAGARPPGMFTFNSLADLELNRPSAFMRPGISNGARTTLWDGALAFGDLWQVTPTFQLQPGVRVEGNVFSNTITANPALERDFGINNTRAPNTIHASPRFGFAWTYRPTVANGFGGTNTTGRIQLPPRAIVSGGIGEFRQAISAGTLLSAATQTGLAASSASLTCVGPATPSPAWTQYVASSGAIPTACADGSQPAFSAVSPSVLLFDPSYSLARSWRGNLRIGSALGRFRYSLDAWYSRNVDQAGRIDLNFTNEPQFLLASEANRPVYVSPSDIVPTTGVLAPAGARRSSAFGSVTDLVSDLHSTARKLTFTVAPEIDGSVLSVAYTLAKTTATTRGFDATTFDSPLDVTRGPWASDIRHQFTISAGHQFGSVAGISAFWRISSGVAYTPLVGQDINGDGLVNDRAFVFDAAPTSDETMKQAMTSLLASAPTRARNCLEQQRGMPASANACRGPWTSTMNAALSMAPVHVLDGRYLIASLSFANSLGGLDQLLHGGDHLHGWGATASPDPILYTVQGFDPQTRSFRYSVNPRFGSTRTALAALEAPFRVTLDVRLELGKPIRRSQYERFLQMAALRGNRAPAPADSLRERLEEEVPDYFGSIFRMRDSLLLTPGQVAVLQHDYAAYQIRQDSLWAPIAAEIYGQGMHADVNDVRRRVDAVKVQAWAIERGEIPKMRAPMTPGQLELLDLMLEPLVRSARKLPSWRVVF